MEEPAAEIKLGPLEPRFINLVLEGLKKRWIEIYAVFGRVPYYYVLLHINEISSYKEFIEKLIAFPFSPLVGKGKRVLEFKFKGSGRTFFQFSERLEQELRGFQRYLEILE